MLKHIGLIATVAGALSVVPAFGQVYVNGYYRSNGMYVQPHMRTAPDGIRSNNYSYPGNYNPNRNSGYGSGYGSGRSRPSSGLNW